MLPTIYWVPSKRPLLAILPAALFAGGCANDRLSGPLTPIAARASMVQSPANAAVDPRAAVRAAVDDALARILPTLDATPETAAVAAAFRNLAAAIDRPDVAVAPFAAQAERAVAQLASLADRRPGEAAELAALQLVLSRVDAL